LRAPGTVCRGGNEEGAVVHPASIESQPHHGIARLQPGCPTAPEGDRLPLLPSGPDGVHRPSLRGTRLSTSDEFPWEAEARRPRPGIQPRCSGLRVQGTASSPPSTTVIDGKASVDIGQSTRPNGARQHALPSTCRSKQALSPFTRQRIRLLGGADTAWRGRRGVVGGGQPPKRCESRALILLVLPARLPPAQTRGPWDGANGVAERGGFEPPTGFPEPHFQCGAIGL
jgi:hypothetical protein